MILSISIGQDLFAISQDQPFRFPSTFTFVIRAFSTLEGTSSLSLSLSFDKNFDKSHLVHFAGIGYILDPDFSFVKVAAPYAQVCVITNLFLSTLNSLYSGSSVSIS